MGGDGHAMDSGFRILKGFLPGEGVGRLEFGGGGLLKDSIIEFKIRTESLPPQVFGRFEFPPQVFNYQMNL